QWHDVVTVLTGRVLTGWENTNYTVCSRHFKPEDYKPNVKFRSLLPGALPSVLGESLEKSGGRKRKRGAGAGATVASEVGGTVPQPTTDNGQGLLEEQGVDDPDPTPGLPPRAAAQVPVSVPVVEHPTSMNLEDQLVEVARAAEAQVASVASVIPVQVPATPTPTPRRRPSARSDQQRRVLSLRKRLSRRETTLRRLRAKVLDARKRRPPPTSHEKKLRVVVAAAEGGDTRAMYILEQLHNFGKIKPRWSEPVVRECVLLQCLSPTAYDQARAGLLLKGMPVRSTLKRYLGPSTGEVGVTSDAQERLKAEVAILQPMERYCSLIVDEMAISEKAILDKKQDQVYGLGTLDEEQEVSQRKLANKLLCFVIHGCSTSYTIPASYYFTRAVSGSDLHRLAMQLLQFLCEIGFFPIRIVGDNASANTKMFRIFGGGKLLPEVDHPILPHLKFFMSFDPNHIVKNLKSQLIERTISAEDGVGNITGQYIAELYSLQKKELIKPVRWLTRKHVTPLGIEKQNVERAVQFFSTTITAALRYLHSSAAYHPRAQKFYGCLHTVRYMETIYKWFQAHNVSNRKLHLFPPYTSAEDERLAWMEGEFLDYMRLLKEESRKRKMSFLTAETWEALECTSLSSPAFIRYLLEQGFFYVLSRRGNSDPVEANFSSVRRFCGSNDMVDARSAVFALEKIIRIGGLKTSRYSNVGEMEAVPYKGKLQRANPPQRVFLPPTVSAASVEIAEKLRTAPLDTALFPSLGNASLALPVSFLLLALEERIECGECLPRLRTLDRDPSPLMALLREVDRGKVPYPSNALMNVAGLVKDFTKHALQHMDLSRRGVTKALGDTLRPRLQACPLIHSLSCGHGETIADVVCDKLVAPLVTNACHMLTDTARPAVKLNKKPVNRKYMRGLTQSAPGTSLRDFLESEDQQCEAREGEDQVEDEDEDDPCTMDSKRARR
ncbi:DNA transposase, partial [Frankliniella fusca]